MKKKNQNQKFSPYLLGTITNQDCTYDGTQQ
jgi:hypothetical protein